MGRVTHVHRGPVYAPRVSAPTLTPFPFSPSEATFAEVWSRLRRSAEIGLDIGDALQAFRLFLEAEENITVGKSQLKVLRGQAVLVLEGFVRHRREGGDLAGVLPVYNQTLFEVAGKINLTPRWDLFIQGTLSQSKLEVAIDEAFHKLAKQLEQLTGGQRADTLLDETQLEKAREIDHKKVASVKLAIEANQDTGRSFQNLDMKAKQLIDYYSRLVITGGATSETLKPTSDPKQTLAAIVELSGLSAPPLATVDPLTVSIGNLTDIRSTSFHVRSGEYFTGQKVLVMVAIKPISKEAAREAYSRFYQLKENWTVLRHDCIHPLYGLGIVQRMDPSSAQLYFVSPHLRNQDVVGPYFLGLNAGRDCDVGKSTYLQMYPMTSESARLQMIMDIAQGLKYMHSEYIMPNGRAVVHRALNIFNVLVKDSGRAVITAFGHADVIEYAPFGDTDLEDYEMYRYVGPELLDEEIPEPTHGNDIWSWAMTSLEILTSEPPFGLASRTIKLIREVLTKLPARHDHAKIENYEHRNEIWQLFEDCWKRRPEDRPSADEVLGHLTSSVKKSISHKMSAPEILRLLSENGYPDITTQINEGQCSGAAINQGGAGDIYRGYLVDGSKVAIKCPRSFNANEDEGRAALKAITKEGYQWLKHKHGNILEIFGLALFQNRIALISPWMENGTVPNYVTKYPGVDRISLCSQVARGLAYLHDRGTIHGDLKAINVLVSEKGIAKIIDFGSTVMNQYSLKFSSGENAHHFSMRWAAPECLEGDDALVSKPADVYALAMSILEIITGKLPFHYLTRDVAVCKAICKGERPRRPFDCIPTSSRDGNKLWSLFESCWEHDPDARPAAADVEQTLSQITHEGLNLKKGVEETS